MSTDHRDLNATVRDRITNLILERGLRPGDPMPTEVELCELMGVSRSSIREAMRTLAALDIVEVRHGTGTFVGHLSLEPLVYSIALRSSISPGESNSALREVVSIRQALDLGYAPTICAALTHEAQSTLERLVNEMIELAERGESFAVPDRQFHRLLLEHSGNHLMADLVDTFWAVHTQLLNSQNVATREELVVTAKAHAEMLQAAQSGDVAAFRKAVNRHYDPLLGLLERSEPES